MDNQSTTQDAPRIVKVVAIIGVVYGIIEIFSILPFLGDLISSNAVGSIIWHVVWGLLLISIAWKLRDMKRWALYAFIALSLIGFFFELRNYLNISDYPASLTGSAIRLGVAYYLYTFRQKFS